MNEVSYRESHKGKGEDYQASFATNPHQAMTWNLERWWLTRLVGDLFPESPPQYLDFACGTGRILSHLAPLSGTATGVDISASMLEFTRGRGLDVELIQADLTGDDVLDDRTFDLITAFRFFPNAEDSLRKEVLNVLVTHLAPDGYLIFNNHKHAGSLARRISLLVGNASVAAEESSGLRAMSRGETNELLAGAGLAIEREIPVISLPFTDRHMFRPAGVLEGIERALARVGVTAAFAQSILYVCRKR